MKLRMSIRQKMLINILSTSVIIFAITVGYMSYKTSQLILEDAKHMALNVTQKNALEIEKSLAVDLSMVKTLANSVSLTNELDEETWKDLYTKIAKQVYFKNEHIQNLVVSWQESFYTNEMSQQRKKYFHFLRRSKEGNLIEYKKYLPVNYGSFQMMSELNKPILLDPRKTKQNNRTVLVVDLLSPIQKDGEFRGTVEANYSTESFHAIVSKIKPYPKTLSYLLGNSGVFVSHPNKTIIGDTIFNYAPHFEEQFNLSELVREGKSDVFKGVDENGEDILLVTAPVNVGDHYAPWALTLVIPVKSILKEANKTQLTSLIVAIIGLILITIIIYWRATDIGRAIKKTTEVLEKLSQGDIENTNIIEMNRGDEIQMMLESVKTLKASLNDTSEFAEKIGEGHLESQFKPLSTKDKLGNSLINMQENLRKAKAQEEQMKEEELKTKWASDGLAQFSETIRVNSENIDDFAYSIIKNLVDYIGCSMGSLFAAETVGDEVLYSVKAAVAYERRKIIDKKFRRGESLIGRCVHEKRTVYLTDIPTEYIRIKSGMGETPPGCLLLVPLLTNGEVLGVIELASLNELEEYKVSFIEKLAENIASALSSAQTNERTVRLLEQSKSQSEELAAQEEEMRQNMEELQATQEEAARREQEMTSVLNGVDKSVFKVEYDSEGIILAINNKYQTFIEANSKNPSINDVNAEYTLLGVSRDEYTAIWENVKKGTDQEFSVNITLGEKSYKVVEHLTPIMEDMQVKKILKVSYVVA